MKTLYVSDLDGTLLGRDARLSEYTAQVINRLADEGMLFSYATARSFLTARKVTAGLNARIPVIAYNGAMIVDQADGTMLQGNFFSSEVHALLDELIQGGVAPIVYALVAGQEKFSFVPERCTPGMRRFIDSRRGDVRTNAVQAPDHLHRGEIFYLTCIDEAEKLLPFYEKYRDAHHCVFHQDIYTGDQWLEIMLQSASKSGAIRQLIARLACDHLVAFGDGKNDVDMFEMADEAYAVSNAAPELKALATAIIGGNDEDGVARWLEENGRIGRNDRL